MSTVRFSKTDTFIEELRFQQEANADLLDVVRVEIESEPINDGATDISLIAGFLIADELMELSIECDVDYLGGSKDGTHIANAYIKTIRTVCDELKIPLRGGRIEL